MFPSIHKITIPTPIHSPKYFDDFPKAFIRDTIRKKNEYHKSQDSSYPWKKGGRDFWGAGQPHL